EADRCGVAVARDAEVDQVPVGEVGAGEDRGHAAVHGVEAVRLAEEVVRGLGAAADAGELGDLMRLDGELVEGLDQRRRDRVVAASGAERADLALVVAPCEAELVLGQAGVVELGFGKVGHRSFMDCRVAKKRPNCSLRAGSRLYACTAVCTMTILLSGSMKMLWPRTPKSAKAFSVLPTSQVW